MTAVVIEPVNLSFFRIAQDPVIAVIIDNREFIKSDS